VAKDNPQCNPAAALALTIEAAVSPLRAILHHLCPRCRQGRIFRGWLAMYDVCPVCGLKTKGPRSLSEHLYTSHDGEVPEAWERSERIAD